MKVCKCVCEVGRERGREKIGKEKGKRRRRVGTVMWMFMKL